MWALGSDEVDLDLSCPVLSCCRSDQIRSDLSFQAVRQATACMGERVGEWERCWPAMDPLFANAFSKKP